MKVKNFTTLSSRIESSGLILVSGPDDFFKIECKNILLKKFNDAEFYDYFGDEITIKKAHEILSEANTLPFLSDKKIFFIKNIDDLKQNSMEIFSDFIENIPSYSKFIFTANKVDGRTSFYKKINKNGIVIKAGPLYENECSDWIDYFLKNYGKSMSREAKALFIDLIGTSLILLKNELEKISIYTKDNPVIGYDDVLNVINSIKMNSIFQLTDAIAEGKKVKTLAILKNMVEESSNEILIISMIARHFRIILKIQEFKKQNKNENYISKELSVNPFFLSNYIKQASSVSQMSAIEFYKKICKTEFDLKSMNWNSRKILENLILDTKNER